MMIIRVTKEFDFETAHALDGYNGKCKDIHGHSYHLTVTVKGEVIDDNTDPKDGMVIDFKDLKSIIKTEIEPIFDHRLILRDTSRFKGIEKINDRVRYVPYQPTCENMLLEIVDIFKRFLPETIHLCKVSLRETANSYSEWLAEDNL